MSSHQNFLFADSYTFGPSYTNEFRFSYGRPDGRYADTGPARFRWRGRCRRSPFANVSAPGLASRNAQFHYGNNFLFQETQTKLSGRHAFRYGVEFLRQTITQARGANDLGSISFTNAVGYSAFANFLDDFSGPSATTNRVFGAPVLHPNQFRQSYFFQDNWKVTPTLALDARAAIREFRPAGQRLAVSGLLRIRSVAVSGAARSESRQQQTSDRPSAWHGRPAGRSGWLGRLFGDGKTVWRGGYQISYDAFFTQLIFLGPATSTPNAISTNTTAPEYGPRAAQLVRATADGGSRSRACWTPRTRSTGTFAIRTPSVGRSVFSGNCRKAVLLDVSYVGSESHRSDDKADFNPRLLNRTAPLSRHLDRATFAPARGTRPTMPCRRAWIAGLRADSS